MITVPTNRNGFHCSYRDNITVTTNKSFELKKPN